VLDGHGIGVQFLAGAGNVHTGSGSHPDCSPAAEIFPQGVKLTILFRLLLRLRMPGAILRLPDTPSCGAVEIETSSVTISIL
jgi:hypothetical protein